MKKNTITVGIGIAALATVAAGAAYLYGTKSGAKKRKEIKSWMFKMQTDIIEKVRAMKDWSETSYRDIVDTVAEKYQKIKTIDPEEIKAMAADLKKHWDVIKAQVEEGLIEAKKEK